MERMTNEQRLSYGEIALRRTLFLRVAQNDTVGKLGMTKMITIQDLNVNVNVKVADRSAQRPISEN